MPLVDKKIRWKQRYSNFEKSLKWLEASASIKKPSETERAGLIQFYEMTFELSWKTLKDYLESVGYEVDSPRTEIKQAFQINLLKNAELWLEALENRNLTAHTYDEAISIKVEALIKDKYLPLLRELHKTLAKQ